MEHRITLKLKEIPTPNVLPIPPFGVIGERGRSAAQMHAQRYFNRRKTSVSNTSTYLSTTED